MKHFSIKASEENSVYVWSSYEAKSFNDMPKTDESMVVFITNAHNPTVTVYDISGFSSEDITELIKRHISHVCFGCNYRYELVRQIGNTYFFN